VSAGPSFFRHALCNEVFEQMDFAESCRILRREGYTGIEIAPFTLAPDPLQLSAARRREVADIIVSEGLEFVGLHWLMVSPKGLHVTTPDAGLRARSWEHIRNLIRLCADLGPGGKMIFGSPKQRNAVGGLSVADATRHYEEGLSMVAPLAGELGVTVLIEALPSDQTDVMLSLDEAAAMVQRIAHSAIQTMFDTHNAVEEKEAHSTLLQRHCPLIQHVHVNESDGRYPGTGNYDFVSLFRTLRQLNYQGWVSLEVFDFKPSAPEIARASIQYLREQIEKANA
jgi:D-psicose/D-tagatose/L-ribulose 3-epimerase